MPYKDEKKIAINAGVGFNKGKKNSFKGRKS